MQTAKKKLTQRKSKSQQKCSITLLGKPPKPSPMNNHNSAFEGTDQEQNGSLQ